MDTNEESYTHTLSYLATCLSMLCGGTTSLFATYGNSFNELLGFTQYETNLVASLGDYAHYMCAPLFGYLATRLGPQRIIQVAGILMFTGYMGLSYAFEWFNTPYEHSHHYVATMSMLFALVGVGSKAAYMSSMATTARNFKHSRYAGIALGLPISLYGLSTFVFSSVKAGWFEGDKTPGRYLAFMAIVSGVVHLLASRFVSFREAVGQRKRSMTGTDRIKEKAVFWRLASDPAAWALLLGIICFSGPGLAFVNNCGSMVRALSTATTLSETEIGQFKDKIVATQSFFSFASRLLVGYLSDVWRHKLRMPRAALLVAAALLMIYAQMFASQVTELEQMNRLAVLIGVSMGSVFTLAPTITAETWGAENFGLCWGVITLGPAIGGHICNLIFGSNWDQGQYRIGTRMAAVPADQLQCTSECFIPAFVINVRIACVGLVFFILVLVKQTFI